MTIGGCIPAKCKLALGFVVTAVLLVGQHVDGRSLPFPSELLLPSMGTRASISTVQPSSTVLDYHNGPLIIGSRSIDVFVIWYGSFNESGKQTVRDFFSSFDLTSAAGQYPSVRSWWNLTAGYVDEKGAQVSPGMHLAGESDDSDLSMGTRLSEEMVEQLVLNSLYTGTNITPGQTLFPADADSLFLVLTSQDVTVNTFCRVCGSHDYTYPSQKTAGQLLSYGWVGNSATQCPELCAWPFVKAPYGSPVELKSPNGDAAIDGMIINIGVLVAGMVTNPFKTGYYQGDSIAPLESASACAGIYGVGAFPGNPGQLFTAPTTNASFNAVGYNGRQFLLPALWLPSNQTCTPPSLT